MGRTSKKLTVAFQGELGAFSEVAARQLCGPQAEMVPCQRFLDVFDRVSSGKAVAAVIPIENTLHGSIHENYDNLLQNRLTIVGETQVRIVHNLIVAAGSLVSKGEAGFFSSGGTKSMPVVFCGPPGR